jgi:hypothetical protein
MVEVCAAKITFFFILSQHFLCALMPYSSPSTSIEVLLLRFVYFVCRRSATVKGLSCLQDFSSIHLHRRMLK